jgi:hypothetical protein
MLHYLLDFFRYSIRTPNMIPPETTHMLKIKHDVSVSVRKYSTLNTFSVDKFREVYLPYNIKMDSVYTDDLFYFKNLTLGEFIHLIVPGETFNIDYIPIEDYNSTTYKSENTENIDFQTYCCNCTHNTDDCVFHKFIIEKIYSKYHLKSSLRLAIP